MSKTKRRGRNRNKQSSTIDLSSATAAPLSENDGSIESDKQQSPALGSHDYMTMRSGFQRPLADNNHSTQETKRPATEDGRIVKASKSNKVSKKKKRQLYESLLKWSITDDEDRIVEDSTKNQAHLDGQGEEDRDKETTTTASRFLNADIEEPVIKQQSITRESETRGRRKQRRPGYEVPKAHKHKHKHKATAPVAGLQSVADSGNMNALFDDMTGVSLATAFLDSKQGPGCRLRKGNAQTENNPNMIELTNPRLRAHDRSNSEHDEQDKIT